MSNKFIINLFNSINGLKLALKEHSFVTEVLGGIIFIPYVLFSDLALIFKLILMTVYFLLLAFELVNTAIEELCNKINKEFDKDIKAIKDLSSSAVFVVLALLLILIILSFI